MAEDETAKADPAKPEPIKTIDHQPPPTTQPRAEPQSVRSRPQTETRVEGSASDRRGRSAGAAKLERRSRTAVAG